MNSNSHETRELVTRRSTLKLLALAPFAVSPLLLGCGDESSSSSPTPPATPKKPDPPAPGPPEVAPAPETPKAPAPEPGAAAAGEHPLVTQVESMEPIVQALQYTSKTSKSDQRCGNCIFFAAKADGLGSCELFAEGFVEVDGWCSSWAAAGNA